MARHSSIIYTLQGAELTTMSPIPFRSGKTFRRDTEPQTDEGRESVRRYLESNGRHDAWAYEYEASTTIPHEPEIVWQVLLETEHLGLWLNDKHTGETCLPGTFGPGQQISDGPPAYIVDCAFEDYPPRAVLVIEKRFYVDYVPYYYRFKVAPHERYSTKFTIHASSSEKPSELKRLMLHLFNKELYPSHKRELAYQIDEALLRFSQLCHDRVHYGPPLFDLQREKGWFVWHGAEGIINYYPNRDGAREPQLGEFIKSSERIGFVFPEGTTGADLEKCKESSYLKPGRGFVREILKKHGDRIGRGERILLLSDALDTDLEVGTIFLKSGGHVTPSSGYFYGLRLLGYLLEEGQPVGYGDTVAVLEESGKRFELKSGFTGVLTKQLLKVGTEVDDYKPIATVRVTKVKGGAEA